jgi:ATP-binding cassette subfamily C protein
MRYIKSFLSYARGKIVLSLALGIFLGMTEGIGLFMLIPFMELIGIGAHSGKTEGIAATVNKIMAMVGVTPTLSGILCIYIALITTQAFASRMSQVIDAEIVSGYTCFLQDQMYSVLAYADWLAFIRLRPSDITHVLAVDVKRVGLITQQLLQLLGTVILSLVCIAVAFTISIPLTLAALACGILLISLLRPLDRRAGQFGKAVQFRLKNQLSEISEHLAGMKLAKSYGMERTHIRHFEAITAQIADQQIGFARTNANTQMYYKIGSAVALSGFLYGAVAMADIKSAGLLLMVFLFARLLPRFSRIQLNLQQIHYNLPSFTAAYQMYRHLIAIREPDAPKQSAAVDLRHEVRFDGVSFSYDSASENRALQDICFSVSAGRMTAIVGPSGAGKSTLADLLLGLLTPTAGSITIDGKPLTGARLNGWRRSVGYVPQETFLFNDTVRANLRWACPQAREEEILSALCLASADEFVACLPRGLDTVLGDRGVRLSGGERQRIALARALLRKPSLLLLDEATSSLDTINEKRIQAAIAGLHGQLTSVVIAHRLSTIREADHIVVLDGGRVVEQGTWNKLAASQAGHFHAMLQTGSDLPDAAQAWAS